MLRYSLVFLGLYWFGVKLGDYLNYGPLDLGATWSSLITTSVLGLPLFTVVLLRLRRRQPVLPPPSAGKLSEAAA